MPREIYLDNVKQFIAEGLREEASKCGIELIFDRPYHPKEREKIEVLQGAVEGADNADQVLVFSSLQKEAEGVRQEIQLLEEARALDWSVPAEIYNDKEYFNE